MTTVTPFPVRARGTLLLASALLLSTSAASCAASESEAGELADRQIRIVTTANFITDTVRQIAGDRADVTGLMGPGVDPHLYQASAGDVSSLRDADAIFYGGLDLEGRMGDLFVELAADRVTVPLSAAVPEEELLEPEDFEGKFDPHVWFDPTLWEYAATRVAETLSEMDPEHAEEYDARLDEFLTEVQAVDDACRAGFIGIEDGSRVLVTSHDAFNYFGDAYDFEVVAIQGVTTTAEATTGDIERVADLLVEGDVSAVFVESSVSSQTIDAVIAAAANQGHDVRVGGELFSDAAGEDGTPEGTYAGMLRHNCELISEGLA